MRLCGIEGSTLSVANPLQAKKRMKKVRSRRGPAAPPKVAVAVMVELGLHKPLAAALGPHRESEMVLAQRVLPNQPDKIRILVRWGLREIAEAAMPHGDNDPLRERCGNR